jgi:hypothetical protein
MELLGNERVAVLSLQRQEINNRLQQLSVLVATNNSKEPRRGSKNFAIKHNKWYAIFARHARKKLEIEEELHVS